MPVASTSTTLSPAELSYLHTSLSLFPPLRPDLRSSTEFRPLRAETDLLPTCNGSAHVSLTDGSEALVGIKAEVHRTPGRNAPKRLDEEMNEKMSLEGSKPTPGPDATKKSRGNPDWISLNVDISTLRDDDSLLIFLSEMLREPLLASTSLADTLIINSNWHWHLHIDILLLSPFTASGTSYPLPLLSLATHLALRSTRLPHLKSHGEEDPLVDDDWESSRYLFPRTTNTNPAAKAQEAKTTPEPAPPSILPPITLLITTAGQNIIFDPSPPEIAVADAILAVSVAISSPGHSHTPSILAVRMIETPARDTMKGTPASGAVGEADVVPGVWRPRVGGVKRELLKRVVAAVMGGAEPGVAREVFEGLEGFLRS